jgi:hypothetical protein
MLFRKPQDVHLVDTDYNYALAVVDVIRVVQPCFIHGSV